ncbi:MAG: hypothetical protein ACRDT2_00070 [Natronosporangium sp.]
MTAPQTRLSVPVAAWTRLPGTPFEVMPHGKRLGGERQVVVITRRGEQAGVGGWDLSPLHRCVFIRRAVR